jgi:hypothetical protein
LPNNYESSGNGQGQRYRFSRRTLKGIKAVAVIVEKLREEAPKGLTEQQLQNDVELRLRNAGIAIIPSNQANQGAAPYLYVRVNSIQCRDFSYRPNTIAQ